MRSIFFRGQKKLLLNTVKTAVTENPITVKKIITCIKLMGILSRYGVNPEVNLRIMLGRYKSEEDFCGIVPTDEKNCNTCSDINCIAKYGHYDTLIKSICKEWK